MATENATSITELDPTKPTSVEVVGEIDDHMNMVKGVLGLTFADQSGDAWDDLGYLSVGPRAINAAVVAADPATTVYAPLSHFAPGAAPTQAQLLDDDLVAFGTKGLGLVEVFPSATPDQGGALALNPEGANSVVSLLNDTSDLAFLMNSVEAMRLDSVGRLGIGGAASSSERLRVTDGHIAANNAAVAMIGTGVAYGTNPSIYRSGGDLSMVFSTGANGEFMRALANGNVGIGVVAPADKLDIAGAIRYSVSSSYVAGQARAYLDSQLGHTVTGRAGSENDLTLASSAGVKMLSIDIGGDLLLAQDAGNVGVNTTTPMDLLHVAMENADLATKEGIVSQLSADANANTKLTFLKSNGTLAAPTAITSGHLTGQIRFQGYDGAAYRESADIYAVTSGTIAAGQVPGNLVFRTTNLAGTFGEAMRINTEGNVGIGTNAPAAPLHVRKDQAGYTYAYVSNNNTVAAGTGAGIAFGDAAVEERWWLRNERDGSGKLNIGSFDFGGPVMTMDASGNVGIGTTAPVQPLHVRKDQAAYTYVVADNNGSVAAGTGSGFAIAEAGNLSWFMRGERDASAKFSIGDSNGVHMTLQTDGNVGIGTNAPGAKLHVEGSETAPITRFRNEHTTQGYGVTIESEGTDANRYAFRVRNLAETNTYFTIQTSTGEVGNVGIGTDAPSRKLHVLTNLADSNVALFGGGNSARGLEIGVRDLGGVGDAVSVLNAVTGSNSGAISFRSDGREYMDIDRFGNVGIGNVSPGRRLDVNAVAVTTPSSGNTYAIGLGYLAQNGLISLGSDATNAYIQSFSRDLHINNQGNDVHMNAGGGNLFLNLPTVGTGPSQSLWNDSGTVKVVP